jgi:hypothetical protein
LAEGLELLAVLAAMRPNLLFRSPLPGFESGSERRCAAVTSSCLA